MLHETFNNALDALDNLDIKVHGMAGVVEDSNISEQMIRVVYTGNSIKKLDAKIAFKKAKKMLNGYHSIHLYHDLHNPFTGYVSYRKSK